MDEPGGIGVTSVGSKSSMKGNIPESPKSGLCFRCILCGEVAGMARAKGIGDRFDEHAGVSGTRL